MKKYPKFDRISQVVVDIAYDSEDVSSEDLDSLFNAIRSLINEFHDPTGKYTLPICTVSDVGIPMDVMGYEDGSVLKSLNDEVEKERRIDMANQFSDRKFNKMNREEYSRIREKGYLETNQAHLADDWVVVYPEGADVKFGRSMYSPSLDRFRHQTMGEFYGGGVVD